MEENAKKTLLIVVAVACLAAAGIITYKTMGGGTAPSQPTGKMWVKCNNPKCGNEYQMNAKDYSDFIMNHGGPRQVIMSGAPPMKCPKCNEDSAFRAMKCAKCGKVFFPGTVEGKAEDTCPGCGYSSSAAPAKSEK